MLSKSLNSIALTSQCAEYLENVPMEVWGWRGSWRGERSYRREKKPCVEGCKHQQSMYDIRATYVHERFGPVVATQSSEANLLWVRSLCFQRIHY